jgi:hypothetical protein
MPKYINHFIGEGIIEEHDYINNKPLLLWYKFSLKDKLVCFGTRIVGGVKYKLWSYIK